MKFHDIVCEADGWAHLVDGVRRKSFPSRFMALNAARLWAQRDMLKGLGVSIRYQAADGTMRPVQSDPLPGLSAAQTGAANQ
jgi:hypothetical protein